MQILKSGNFGALIEQSANAAGGGVGGRKCRDAGNIVANRSAANGFFVVEGLAAQRRVDDQVDLAGFNEVDDVGAAFVYFENGFRPRCLPLRAPRRCRASRANGSQVPAVPCRANRGGAYRDR